MMIYELGSDVRIADSDPYGEGFVFWVKDGKYKSWSTKSQEIENMEAIFQVFHYYWENKDSIINGSSPQTPYIISGFYNKITMHENGTTQSVRIWDAYTYLPEEFYVLNFIHRLRSAMFAAEHFKRSELKKRRKLGTNH